MFHLFCNSTAFSGLKYPLFPSKFEPLKALGCAPSAPKPVLKFRRPKCRIPVLNLLGTGFNDANSPKKQPRTLFPGGFKRPEIKAPSLVLRLNSGEVLRRDGVLEVLDMAVSEAVSIVVLESGGGEGGRLYEAACILKALVRDRAYLLIAERVDIAAAVGASGVVLSDQGLPAIVARNMMMESKSGSVVLPLVVRMVQTAKSALSASASEGADFLIFGINSEEEFEMLAPSVFQHVKVPVFPMIDSLCGGALLTAASRLLQAGASGLVISSEDLKHFSDDVLHRLFSTIYAMKKGTQDQFQRFGNQGKSDVDQVFYGTKRVAGFTKSEDREKQMIEAERLVLLEAIPVIRKAAPLMEEVSLLMDAVAQLDEPFLLVIVGEFNSGKSTVINALLGRRYLRDGVVPTTNEITLLCYSEMDFGEQERSERHPDGQFIRFLPAPILKEMNLVDTPGTNVILQRQQRLTEEFLPRADLLLFVISADRPLTESEVTFLRYVQQWKKKVVFVLNKSDLYQNSSELEEATAFIKENAQKLLNTEYVTLYPISARSALEAKLSALTNDGSIDEELLSSDPRWKTSSFNGFQKFLLSFLDRATDMGIERVRLKLETPIGVAETLISACEKHVLQECDSANRDLVSVKEIVSSVKYYAEKMENESISWRKRSSSLIETAKTRAVKLVESTLQLSNLDLVASYAFKGEKSSSIPSTSTFQNEIISPALSDTKKLLEDYLTWLESSCYREGRQYKESFEKKWPTSVNPQEKLHLETQLSRGEEHSVLVTEKFSPSATAKLFDREIREVLLGTFGGLGAAGLSASLLTSVLPTTLEDLLALGLCSAGGLLSISNFPARRNEVADKVKRAANSLQNELEEAMQKDLMQTIGNLERFVESISRPYRDAVQHRLDHLLEIREELQNMDRKLRTLQLEIQNLHVR